MSLRKCATLVTTLCAVLFAGALFVSAQEADATVSLSPLDEVVGEAADPEAVDPREAALSLLEQVQSALSAAVLAGDDAPGAVQQVINLLEGVNGPNYVPGEAGVVEEAGVNGAIAYVEQLAGRTAEELASLDLEALVEQGWETPEVLSLAHLLLARNALVEGGDDPAAVEAAAAHVSQAVALLRGE